MIRMVADPELPPDDGRHALGSPDITTEAERLGPLCQQPGELRPLLRRQFRLGPGARPALQGRLSTLASTPHPLADGPSRDPSASAIFCWLQPFAFNAHARSRRSSRHSFARPGACPILQCTAQVGPALAFYAKINN